MFSKKRPVVCVEMSCCFSPNVLMFSYKTDAEEWYQYAKTIA